MMRPICCLLVFFFLPNVNSAPSRYELFSWERGIGLQLQEQPDLKVYLWFYEWNMFGAVNPAEHSRGDWENKVTISEDHQTGEIKCAPYFTLHAEVNESGADLTLQASNQTQRDWPELAGVGRHHRLLLKGAPEFAAQSNDNKIYQNPYAACSDQEGNRWVITAWERCARPWGNARCPCLHSDPQFADCPPGQTVKLRGRLSFYEGKVNKAEFERIDATVWR